MSQDNLTASTSMEGHSGDHNAAKGGFLSPDATMILLTWITFIILLAILHKFAWKPILNILDKREETIRQALENADKARTELAKIHETRDQIFNEAAARSKEIIEQSRRAAIEAAKIIAHKAREEAQILLENAQREMKDEQEKAQFALREESARIAVELAGRLISENLDDEKNRRLVNQLIKEI